MRISKSLLPLLVNLPISDCLSRGSVSAEHGLGLMKATKIGYSKSFVHVGLMKEIKQLYDPKGILNPYKYIQG